VNAPAIPYWLGEGCQNSFILFDLLGIPQYFDEEFLARAHQNLLVERKDDALILLPAHRHYRHLQLKMIILEPDASLAAFCGNGARVVAAYLQRWYIPQYESFSILACDGDHKLFLLDDGWYGVDMLSTETDPHNSLFVAEGALALFQKEPSELWSLPLTFDGRTYPFFFTESGEPHLVLFENVTLQTLTALGTWLNSDCRAIFPQGININRVEQLDDSTIEVMTYERGVNRVTPACGTGSTSSAVLCRLLDKSDSSTITVQTSGGVLHVDYDQHQHSILKGHARVWQKTKHSPSGG
jgi:diaminopimelate epimerase